ncbi:3-hydroxyacyl-CoA dehydrogenase family protein [Streptomyces sp. NPDC047315]|uniref:3-hydroxyacyl-CoA dehydrogenase family protein n=1 Tax=Streptomyces sp. NPDC047315 TaxID=3155142 RepID=UPI0033E874F3
MTENTRGAAQDRAEPVGVVGAGTMGVGVCQSLIQAGLDVVLVEPDARAADGARERLAQSLRLTRLLGRGPAEVGGRVQWAHSPEALDGVGFVVECAPENRDLKESLFAELDRICPPRAVFASCTSAIPIALLAARTSRPERVLGLHFMNPVPLKDTVEVVRAEATSQETMDRALALLGRLGKETVVVPDGPGFVLNRVLMLCIAQAAALVDEGAADGATVDAVFEKCLGHPMGPLRTADLIGLDNVMDTMAVLREQTGDDRYAAPPTFAALVADGHLGRKTGKGFHDYS